MDEFSMGDLERLMQELAERTAGGSESSSARTYSDCGICGGDGYTHEILKDGTMRTRPCVCRVERQNLVRIKRSGLERAIQDFRFDNFFADTTHARQMRDAAEKYVRDVDAGGEGWLYIGGSVGCGKTHICTAASAELMRRGKQVLYMEWLPVSRGIKAAINEEGTDALIQRYIDADVLYIDDLFKAQHRDGQLPRPTEADVRLAFEVVNGRYVRREPTIITSEWYMDELLDIDEGTFSRLYQMAKDSTLTIKRERGKNRRLQA